MAQAFQPVQRPEEVGLEEPNPKTEIPNPGNRAVPSPTVWFFGFGAWCLFVIWNLALAISSHRGAGRPAYSGHDVSCPYSPSSLLPVGTLFWWHRLSSLCNDPRMSAPKNQITNHKSQIPNKNQVPKPKFQTPGMKRCRLQLFGSLDLVLVCDLEFGACDFPATRGETPRLHGGVRGERKDVVL